MSLYESLFKALNDAKVKYVVVGGLATVLHGYARMTADIDLLVSLESEDAKRAIDALLKYGMMPRLPVDPAQFADEKIRQHWRHDKNMEVFSLYHPKNALLSVDLFIHEPIPYVELIARSEKMNIGDIVIPVCSLQDLIRLKTQAARPKDIDDIEHLKEIFNIKNNGDDNGE